MYSFSDPRAKKAWNFLWLNLLSVGAMLGLFFLVRDGEFLTGAFATSWHWLSRHQVVMALAASTPFFAALLVGRASSAKAKRRRMAEARLLAQKEAAEARRIRELARAQEE